MSLTDSIACIALADELRSLLDAEKRQLRSSPIVLNRTDQWLPLGQFFIKIERFL